MESRKQGNFINKFEQLKLSKNRKNGSFFPCSLLPALCFLIICFGILVRVIQYLFNRSLWADEAVLALNIVNRSYLELLQPLDYDQGAPIGFLWVEKLAVQLFGDHEYALRLFPLFSSIISFFLFYELAKRCIQRPAIPIALALFASLPHLVYFASEVKQYSTDVAVALLSCLIAMQLRSPRLNIGQVVTCSLVGAIAIWFSHPAIFILAGVGITSLLIRIVNKEKVRMTSILVIYCSWLLSFVGFYFVSLRPLSGNEDLLTSWKGAFPSSPFDVLWLLDAFGQFFYKPLGFKGPLDGLAIIVFLVGCVSCLKRGEGRGARGEGRAVYASGVPEGWGEGKEFFDRKKESLFILLSPLVVTFFAAYLHKYPFRSRLVLFLTPFVILLIAEGADYLRRKFRSKPTVIFSALLIGLLIYPPLSNTSKLLTKPYLREEIRPVISYVKTHQKPGDILYIYQRGTYQFKYYAEKYGYQEGDYIIGVEDLDKYDGRSMSDAEWQRYKNDLDKLRGNQRVWLLFSHAFMQSENQAIKSYLDSIGKQVDFFQAPGAFVYLYDLTN